MTNLRTLRKKGVRKDAASIMANTHVIVFTQTKEFPNLRRPLRAQPLGMHRVRQSRQLLVPLLHNAERQHAQIHPHDASSNALPPSLARSSGSVARVAGAEQQSDTGRVHDTLLHGEPLLVVAAGDAKDVAFEFRTDGVAGDFLAHAAVHEDAEAALVFDLNELLSAISWVGDVELHLDGSGGDVKVARGCSLWLSKKVVFALVSWILWVSH